MNCLPILGLGCFLCTSKHWVRWLLISFSTLKLFGNQVMKTLNWTDSTPIWTKGHCRGFFCPPHFYKCYGKPGLSPSILGTTVYCVGNPEGWSHPCAVKKENTGSTSIGFVLAEAVPIDPASHLGRGVKKEETGNYTSVRAVLWMVSLSFLNDLDFSC